MDNLPPNMPDMYLASAVQDGRDALDSNVNVTREPSTLEITLKRGLVNVEGTVFDTHGQPVPNALVGLVTDFAGRNSKMWSLQRTVRTDQTGKYVLSDLRPGDYRVYARTTYGLPKQESREDLAESGISICLGENEKITQELRLGP